MSTLTAVPAQSLELHQFSSLEDRHRAVMSLFPRNLPGHQRERRSGSGILFRVEATRSGTNVLVRSKVEPARSVAGLRTRPENLDTPAGARVRWRLAAGGVVRRDGREITASLERSVQRYLDTLGEAMEGAQAIAAERQVARGDHRVLPIDTIDGTGVVSDPERLAELLAHGLGRSKAYGCGLLTVAVLR